LAMDTDICRKVVAWACPGVWNIQIYKIKIIHLKTF